MWIVFATLSAIIFGISSVIMKAGTLKKQSDYYILWGLYASGSIFFAISAHGQYNFQWNLTLIISSILVAIGSFFGNYFVIKALETGPASLTAPMLNINLPLIIILSIFYYGEPLTIIKTIIIIILFVAILLVKFDPNENISIKDKRWFFWVISASLLFFLREGGLKITLELGLNNQIILLNAYVICLIFSTIFLYSKRLHIDNQQLAIINNVGKNKGLDFIAANKGTLNVRLSFFKRWIKHLRAIKYGLSAGVCSGGGLFLYSLALSTGPASIVALIFSSRSLVIILISTLLFKEKLSIFQKYSITLLCIGLALSSFI